MTETKTVDIQLDKFNALASIAHEVNLIWGVATNTVVDNHSWGELTDEEKDKKAAVMRKLYDKFNVYEPHDKSLHCEVSPKRLHDNWMKTASHNHPCKKEYDELPRAVQAKDHIYALCLKLINFYEEK